LLPAEQRSGEEDVGYGPARGFSSAQVKQIAAALEGIDRAALAAKFDGKAMARAKVYPEIWARPDDQTRNLEYLLRAFDSVVQFVSGAAEAGEALLVYLN
jgi:hypothetical protein